MRPLFVELKIVFCAEINRCVRESTVTIIIVTCYSLNETGVSPTAPIQKGISDVRYLISKKTHYEL